jgi:putative hydrolase of the HAD superfamily
MTDSPAVLFDFGGTLDADGVHWAPRFHAAYQAAGGALDYSAFEAHFHASERALEGLPQIRTLGFRALVAAQSELLAARLPDGARVGAAAMAERFSAPALAIVARNRPILERLARRYRLGVVSNFTGNLEPCLVELGLRPWFSVVSDSAVLGVAKPDPRIFVDTLARLGARPSGAWMVGDNFEADIRPALALGLRTCWLAPPERSMPAGATPTARIARLPELEGALAGAEAGCGTGACTA